MRSLSAASALLWFSLAASIAALPIVGGWGAIWPESILDRDPLFASEPPPPRPISSDLSPLEQHYPRDLAFARGLHAGRLDLWNPLASAGTPLWAEQGAPFFPLKLPFYLAPSAATYQIYLLLRLPFAALGAYLLARRRGLGHVPALAAGLSLELCGSSMAWLPHGPASPVYVLPWVLLGAFSLAHRRKSSTIAGAALALALAASGGHPTLILLVFAAFAAAVAGHAVMVWKTPRAALAICVAAAAAVVLALALAAPSLLPLAELAQAGSSYKDRLSGTLMWRWQLDESRRSLPIALFAPGTFHALHAPLQTLFDFSAATGLLALVLAVAGILCGGLDAALLGVAVLGIAITCAPPGVGWLHALPGFRLILPTYGWMLVVLALTQAAGSGMAAFERRGGTRAVALAAVLVLVGGVSLLLVGDSKFSKPFATLLAAAVSGPDGLARLLLPPLFAAAVLAIAFVLRAGGRTRWSLVVLAASLALEPLVEIVPLVWTRPSSVLRDTAPPAVRFLRERVTADDGRLMGFPYTIGRPMTAMLFGLADLRGSSPLPVTRYLEYLRAIDRNAGQFVVQTVPFVPSPLLDAAAVRYFAFAHPDLPTEWNEPAAMLLPPTRRPADGDPDLPVAYSDERVVIYENRKALPRARVAHDAVVATDPAAAARLLATSRHDSVVVEVAAGSSEALPAPLLAEEGKQNADPPPSARSGSDVRITDATDPDRLVLEASLAADGLVIVADTYYPGWKASVDGAPVSILPADVMFRAVRVPAGKHTIEFRYQPSSFRIGSILFVLGMIATVILFWGAGWRRSPPSSSPSRLMAPSP